MKEKIKSEIALAIILACNEIIESLKSTEKSTDEGLYAGLMTATISLAMGRTMQNMAKNLDQASLNVLGEILEINK